MHDSPAWPDIAQSYAPHADVCMHAGYEDFAGKLVSALRQAIETDLSDAEEREVWIFLSLASHPLLTRDRLGLESDQSLTAGQ